MLRTLRCFIVLACLLLASCASDATLARSQTSLQTTNVPEQSSVSPTTSQINSPSTSPTASTAATPVSAFVPQEVDRLPLNQPWFLRQHNVVSINRVGEMVQLRAFVTNVIERSPLPPLLLTQSASDAISLIDTNTWRSIPINVPDDTELQSFVASPDGRQLAVSATFASAASHRKAGSQIVTINLETGQMRTLVDGDAMLTASPASPLWVLMPLSWDGATLYTTAQQSASSTFWRLDTASANPTPQQVLAIGETAWPRGWKIATNAELAYITSPYTPELRLRNLRTLQDVVVNQGETPAYALSADGQRIAFLKPADTAGTSYTLMLYDSSSGTTSELVSNLAPPIEDTSGDSSVEWFGDGQRLLLRTQGATEVVRVAPDGKVVSQKPIRPDTVPMLDEDSLLLVRKDVNSSEFYISSLQIQDIANIPEEYWAKVIYIP